MECGSFDRRLIRIPPGAERPYLDADWADALVVVGCGVLEVEGLAGSRWRFEKGAILWLTELPVRTLHNPGTEATVLMAISRR